MKFAYNECCGSYILSPLGIQRYHELTGICLNSNDFGNFNDICYNLRTDPNYIQVIEELEFSASPYCAPDIIEIPDEIISRLAEHVDITDPDKIASFLNSSIYQTILKDFGFPYDQRLIDDQDSKYECDSFSQKAPSKDYVQDPQDNWIWSEKYKKFTFVMPHQI